MRTRILFSVFILLLHLNAFAQRNSLLATISESLYKTESKVWIYKKPLDQDWERLLNFDYLNHNISLVKEFEGEEIKPFYPIALDKIIIQSQLEYLKSQLNIKVTKRWKRDDFKSRLKILSHRVRLSPHQNFKKIKSYYQISEPLFTEDLKIALIQIDYLCGMECGGGQLYIYQYVDEEWIELCFITRWIS